MKKSILLILLSFVFAAAGAQEKLKFRVAEFEPITFDTSASDNHQKYDGDGKRYAIVKVTSTNPDDRLTDYKFDFGNMASEFYKYEDETLWLYVQRNAKRMTIRREGYATITAYALPVTIEEGKVYNMVLSADAKKIYSQMLRFKVSPADADATIIIKREGSDAADNIVWHTTNGEVARSLELGTYSYTVHADNYYSENGSVRLSERNGIKEEPVHLTPNFGVVTLQAADGAEILINGEKIGTTAWTGRLRSGTYSVECRLDRHRPTTQNITVEDNDTRTFTLKAPEPITGTLSVTSTPLEATIEIDGKPLDKKTPFLQELIIGSHKVRVTMKGYAPMEKQCEVVEGQTLSLDFPLSSLGEVTFKSRPTGAELYIDGEYVGRTPYTKELTSGVYNIRATSKGCQDYSKRLNISIDNPSVRLVLSKEYFKKTSFYMDVHAQTGSLGIGVKIGASLNNFNFEGSFVSILDSETLYYNSIDEEHWSQSFKTNQPYLVSIKGGYGFLLFPNIRLTPQLGVGMMMVDFDHSTDYISLSDKVACVTFGLRGEIALTRNFGLSINPEYLTTPKKSNLTKVSDKINRWTNGMNLQLGVYYSF